MSDFEDFIEFVHYAARCKQPGPRRYFRDYSDPFTKYTVQKFHSLYRFTPDAVKNRILPMLDSTLKKSSRRGLPFAPEIMILITLRYYATGCYQKTDEDFMDVCQQSASRIIAKISRLIADRMRHYVKFPTKTDEVGMLKQKFYENTYFPEIIGCIDCTHIKIKSPGGNSSEAYKNKMGWFSVKVQAVIGPNLQFFDIVARWPGSTDNSVIFNHSVIKQRLENGSLQGVLLGNSEYVASNVLLTPIFSANSIQQEQYNTSLNETRNVVESAFGIWKNKFPCLQIGMGLKLDTVVAVISACAVLHNISLMLNEIKVPNEENYMFDHDLDIQLDENHGIDV